MAKPRIFVSSTYYDLKHIRNSLDLFIDSLGYEPVLSEKGDIAYAHDQPLDESCYREAENSDILVLIIGGRYGSEASSGDAGQKHQFYDRYESITKKEFETAASRDIPVYILIEKGVYSEYQTFLKNRDNDKIVYAHVDSVNIFRLIEMILSLPRNNPVQAFEKFNEIECWLRDQWAGLFRELLRRQSQRQQLTDLTTQVSELKEINETLRKYLEAVLTGAPKDKKSKLIESEEKRLEEVRQLEKLKSNPWVSFINRIVSPGFEVVMQATKQSESALEYLEKVCAESRHEVSTLHDLLLKTEEAQKHFNEAREIVGAKPLAFDEESLARNASVIDSDAQDKVAIKHEPEEELGARNNELITRGESDEAQDSVRGKRLRSRRPRQSTSSDDS